MAEVLMYDRISQYLSTQVVHFRFRTQAEKEGELP